MTELQKKMESAVGHNVELHIVGGLKPCIGRCVGFTPPYDNEPEVATVDIKVDGMPSVYEITEDEIESLKVEEKSL